MPIPTFPFLHPANRRFKRLSFWTRSNCTGSRFALLRPNTRRSNCRRKALPTADSPRTLPILRCTDSRNPAAKTTPTSFRPQPRSISPTFRPMSRKRPSSKPFPDTATLKVGDWERELRAWVVGVVCLVLWLSATHC